MVRKRPRRDGAAMETIIANARDSVRRAAIIVQREITKIFPQGGSRQPSPAGSPPNVQTGNLRQSIQVDLSELETDPLRPRALVGPDSRLAPYARIQEFGGEIRAKGGALTVPIGVEGRRAATEAAGRGVRSLDLVFIKRKGGKNPLLARKRADGTIIPLFVLAKSVTLPPRPYIGPALVNARRRVLAQFSGITISRGV